MLVWKFLPLLIIESLQATGTCINNLYKQDKENRNFLEKGVLQMMAWV